MKTDVRYNGQILRLTEFYGEPCLFIKHPSQRNMPKMQFVGGYPDEYCIYLKDMTGDEINSITDMKGRRIREK